MNVQNEVRLLFGDTDHAAQRNRPRIGSAGRNARRSERLRTRSPASIERLNQFLDKTAPRVRPD